ncbi:PEP-CTERM sorting domain-containing protein [uncultured Nitrosomonas sp.]|uniref:PEP-CTERM sorting domain-containing protein n=1 Tax=uncultured Nitrosomonas sp. TaxID=156424 RepID=UPI0025D33682|nr:PEP-CTERM sorting domain-containing protein [uncultured Nitrosomonas sp.]
MKFNTIKKTIYTSIWGTIIAIGSLLATPVNALTLDDSTVSAAVYCCSAPTETYRVSNFVSATVADGIEFPENSFTSIISGISVIPLNIDIGTTTIDLHYTGSAIAASGTFNGYVFSFSGAPTITNVTINAASTFNPTGLSFTTDSVLVDNAGLHFTSSSHLLLDVSLVPEPSTYAMLIVGVLTILLAYRRRNQHQA